MENVKIAVVGLGPAGLTAIKALREEGFNVVGFERRDRVGGLWSYSSDPSHTSVIQNTVSNISKFVSGFSDFPVPKEYPPYMTGSHVAEYFQAYARHFQLEQHIRFRTTVRRVLRDKLDSGWNVQVSGPDGESTLHFDKVVFGNGCETVPKWPPMPGKEKFKGTVLHGQSYRKADQFAGKRVLVVGIGNTACEVSLSLAGHVSTLYQSYRRGRIIVSRYLDDGVPTDSTIPWPVLRLKYLLDYSLPWLTVPLVDRFMQGKMISDAAREDPTEPGLSARARRKRAEKKITEDWRLVPCPSMAHEHPAVQEHFIPALYEGRITPVPGFKAFTGDDRVLLDDGKEIEVDAVIFCTGYSLDFSVMPELEMDGACDLPLVTADEAQSDTHVPHLPRLHRMLFPPRWASSAAFLSWIAPQEAVWCTCELASTAVAQVWAAESARELRRDQAPAGYRKPALLPSAAEMNAEVDEYHAWWRREWAKEPSVRPGYVRAHTFYRAMHELAGTGMYDNIDHLFALRGWRLWWQDRDLYKWLSKGPMNSYGWRVFETNPKGIPGCGRRALPEARKNVEEAYELYQRYKQDMKDGGMRKKVMPDD